MTLENHPLQPFLPPQARLLMLGSFPPPHKRWCMEFFYPNYINDMWRIFGLVFCNDRNALVDEAHKTFRQSDIVSLLRRKGIAIYDTATQVRRLQDNASDKFLEVVKPTDLPALFRSLPELRAVCTTGQKATDTLISLFGAAPPMVGASTPFETDGRTLQLYRMPSSSRAYPLSLEKKAQHYRRMFAELRML